MGATICKLREYIFSLYQSQQKGDTATAVLLGCVLLVLHVCIVYLQSVALDIKSDGGKEIIRQVILKVFSDLFYLLQFANNYLVS